MELFHQGLSDHVIEVINLMCPHQETQLLLVRVIDARCLSNHGCAQHVPMWDSPHLSYSKDPMNRGTISAKIFADPWGGHVGASLALMAHQCRNPTSQGGIFKAPVSLFKGTGQKYYNSIHSIPDVLGNYNTVEKVKDIFIYKFQSINIDLFISDLQFHCSHPTETHQASIPRS